MKKEGLKELLLRSLTEEITEKDRKLLEEKAIPEYKFSSSFSEIAMSRIAGGMAGTSMRPEKLRMWNKAFVRIALSGAAIIIILIVSILLTQGSLSYDTLLGLDSSVDEGLVSLLIK
jgi:hypothetical protein